MSRRILMATVAAIALAVPAAAQDQKQPLETQEEGTQQLEQTQDTLQEQGGEAAGTTEAQPAQPPVAAEEPAGQPPVTAEEPAEQPPITAEEPAEEAAEEELAEEEQAPPADMEFIEVQDAAQFLAEDEVIGKDVVNINDEEVGTITDLVMDQDQKLVGIVLSVGGFLGIADKWVAIPVDQIDFPTDEEPARLRVAVTEEQLKNAPDFMTREEVEAEEAAQQAQQQAVQGQAPAPAATSQ
jgi:PRC-barrel domain